MAVEIVATDWIDFKGGRSVFLRLPGGLESKNPVSAICISLKG
jgi:hypothetical protein